MMRSTLAVAMIVALGACSGSDEGSGSYVPVDLPDASSGSSCVDEDGDGFGLRCPMGPDCDDAVAEITDICYRCMHDAMSTGCPCEPGTEAVECDTSELAALDYEDSKDGTAGVFKCVGGARYCRDGYWQECQGIEWVFQAH